MRCYNWRAKKTLFFFLWKRIKLKKKSSFKKKKKNSKIVWNNLHISLKIYIKNRQKKQSFKKLLYCCSCCYSFFSFFFYLNFSLKFFCCSCWSFRFHAFWMFLLLLFNWLLWVLLIKKRIFLLVGNKTYCVCVCTWWKCLLMVV